MRPNQHLIAAMLLGIVANKSSGQSISPFILNAGGNAVQSGNIIIEQSFGEMLAIETQTGNTLILTCGILQPALNGSQIPLPLLLTQFGGTKLYNYNRLTWTAANESSLAYYELQRSDNASLFQTIYSITARNQANSNYAYDDYKPFAENVYYRLRIIEAGGNVLFSPVVVIRSAIKSGWVAYPNPITQGELLQIGLNNTGGGKSITINLADVLGRIVFSQRKVIAKGYQVISLPIGVASGMYSVQLSGFDAITQKIIVH